MSPADPLSPPAPVSPPAPELLGRRAELTRLDALLDGARASHGSTLVLRGAAGIGKSALLAAVRARAGDMCVLRCHGVESESELPFAALHELVRPMLSRIAALPPPQASALRSALGLKRGGGDQRYLVSVATLSLLSEAAEDGPLLCVVDDAHWLDEGSAEALAFAARRLDAERIAMLFAAREGEVRVFEAQALPELALDGLEPEAAAALLESAGRGGLSPGAREQIVAASAGNPLALFELSSALSTAQRSGAEPLRDPLPVGAHIERAFLAPTQRLPEATQALLLVAAADDSGRLATVLDAARQLGVAAEALDPAQSAELVRVRAARIELRHPLLRSAVYQAAPASQRRRAHGALAQVLGGEAQADRRAWHRAAAAVEPDAAVAGELERAALRARGRGAFAAASLAHERAAALTLGDGGAARQLAAAGECARIAGRPERALALLRRARPGTRDPLLLADIDRLRGLLELDCGMPADACQLLIAAARRVSPHDGSRGLYMLSIASLAATYACDRDDRRDRRGRRRDRGGRDGGRADARRPAPRPRLLLRAGLPERRPAAAGSARARRAGGRRGRARARGGAGRRRRRRAVPRRRRGRAPPAPQDGRACA